MTSTKTDGYIYSSYVPLYEAPTTEEILKRRISSEIQKKMEDKISFGDFTKFVFPIIRERKKEQDKHQQLSLFDDTWT